MSTDPQWQFVGNVPENYERYLVPSIFAPWAHDLIEASTLRPGECVLDIACGPGLWRELRPALSAAKRLLSGWISVHPCSRLRARPRKPKACLPSGGKALR